MADEPLTRTLILEIALPDFHAEDYRMDGDEVTAEALRMFFDTDGDLTPEQLAEAALEDSGLTTSRINLSLLIGGKDGNWLEHVKGQLVGSRIMPRTPDHELIDDERLDEYEIEWIEREARRIWEAERE